MKVLVINYEYPPIGSGAANATYNILKSFSRKNDLEITLVTSSPDKFSISNPSKNIRVYRIDIGKKYKHKQSYKDLIAFTYKALSFCKKLTKEEKFDLVHSYMTVPAGYIAYKLKLPYIIDLRGSGVPGYNEKHKLKEILILKSLTKKIWRKASLVSANSKDLKRLAHLTLPKLKIYVNPNGVDTDVFFPTKNMKEKFNIISASRLAPNKGLEYLIEGFSMFYKLHNTGKLVIAGTGEMEWRLRYLCKKFHLSDQVKFTGRLEHSKLSKEYRNSDIFISSSKEEGMSNSMLEAMASGLAIIATDTGDSKKLIKDCGIIIEKKSPQAIKNALEKYLNRNLLALHKHKARLQSKKYTWDKTADKYHSYYKKICNKRKKKVLFISRSSYALFNPLCNSTFGGSEVDVFNVSTELAEDSRYDVCCTVGDFGQPQYEKRKGVKLLKTYKLSDNILTKIIKLTKVVKKNRPDYLFLQGTIQSTLPIFVLSKILKIKTVFKFASMSDFENFKFKKLRFYSGLKLADKIICQTRDQQKALHKTPLRCTIIRNAVKVNTCNLGSTSSLFFLWVGRSAKVKQPFILLDLAKKNPRKKFVMICPKANFNSVDYSQLQQDAKHIKNINFLKRVNYEKINSYFKKCTCLINTSLYEGYPNTFVQAFAEGKPVISLNVNPDKVLTKNNCGFFANGNLNEINNIVNLDLEDIKKKKNSCFDYYNKNHNIKKTIKKYKKIFDDY